MADTEEEANELFPQLAGEMVEYEYIEQEDREALSKVLGRLGGRTSFKLEMCNSCNRLVKDAVKVETNLGTRVFFCVHSLFRVRKQEKRLVV